ncbi:hypothetical protein MMC27_006588 [Xylographa pallens]|nr:hypothetical protein [Xylographa pallens]
MSLVRTSSLEESFEDQEALLEKSDFSSRDYQHRHWIESPYIKAALGILVVVSTFLLGCLAGQQWPQDLDRLCVDQFATWSPIARDVDITLHEQFFNTSLLKPSLYRHDPGPEVDQAWEDLGSNYGPVGLTDEEAIKSRISLDHARAPQELGGQIIANVEVLHELHCLNVLRRTNYWNYEHYAKSGQGEFANEEKIVRLHVGHCMDMIRQRLMCTGDTALVSGIRIRDYDGPYPDFDAVPHKCKNFEDIRLWAKAHILPWGDSIEKWYVPQLGEKIYEEIPW